MGLTCFLSLILALMLVIWLFPNRSAKHGIKWYSSKSPIPYFIVLLFALAFSYWTFARYAKSCGDPGYYKNTDYHLIQQEGFCYPAGQTAWLCSKNEDSAILSSDVGNLWLGPNVQLFTDTSFALPLYIGRKEKDNEKIVCEVANNIEEYRMESGDELTILRENDTLLTLQYVEIPREIKGFKAKMRDVANRIKGILPNGQYQKQYDFLFCFSVRGSNMDSVIKKQLSKGYNLAELLQEGSNTRLDPNLASLFGDCYLIRDSYTVDATGRKNASQDLYLFAREVFSQGFTVCKNGTPIRTRLGNTVNGRDMEDCYFFYGLGATESPIYHVSSDGTKVSVTYRHPKKFHFPSDLPSGENKMFISTDIQEIVDHQGDFDCFYQFNEQASENNIYKATAVVDFFIDSARVSLGAKYSNWYGDQNGNIGEPDTICIDKEFEVATQSCQSAPNSVAQLTYLFKIRDMRSNEVYKGAIRLYITLLFMLLAIYLMIHYLQNKKNKYMNKWYIIETSVYLVLIAFLTVRLVLLWRLHTFPPIENASFHEFNTLTDSEMYTWTLWCIVSVLGLRMLIIGIRCILSSEWFQKRLNNLKSRSNKVSNWLYKRMSDENFLNIPARLFKKLESKPFDLKNASNAGQKAWFAVRNFFISRWFWAFFLPIATYVACALCCTFFVSMCVVIKEGVVPVLAFAINSMYFVFLLKDSNSQSAGQRGSLWKNIFKRSYWRNIIGRNSFYCWVAILVNTAIYLALLFVPVLGFNEKGMFLPMVAVFSFWFLISVWFTKSSKGWKWTVTSAAVFALIVVFLQVAIAGTGIGKKLLGSAEPSAAKSRVETLLYKPSDMIQQKEVKFKDESMQIVLDASSNKWFIDNHLIQRERQRERSGASKNQFLLDKEYNQMAVSYITQTRDLLLLRYLYYEHGKGVVKLLVLILLILIINIYIAYKKNGQSLPYLQFVPLQAAIFLFIYSAYLFLVNMNAVVFVGLDFPFLTLASKVAPLGLLLPLLAVILPLNIEKSDDSLVEDVVRSSSTRNPGEKTHYAASGIFAAVFALFLLILPGHRANKHLKMDYHEKGVWELPSFSVSMEPLADFVDRYLNPAFREWQGDHRGFRNMSIKNSNLKDSLKYYCSVSDDALGYLNQLKAYTRDHKSANDTAFISSAFDKLFQTSLTETNNLIFLRKQKGEFVFVANKLYYDMKPIFKNEDAPEWEGDLLASRSASQVYFVGNSGTSTRSFAKADSLHFVGKERGRYRNYLYRGQDQSELACELYQIPARYCYKTDKDVFVLVCNVWGGSTKSFTVHPKGDGTISLSENLGMVILPNDIVQVTGARYPFSLRTEGEHYFAKRIHYNGKHQSIYPLGPRFMFAYNLDQLLVQSYPPVEAKQPVRLSLDYELFENVYNYCSREMRNNRRGYGDGVAVTAVDGNGCIRMLFDYNPNRKENLDPNQTKKLNDRMSEIYLDGDNAAERGLFQNRNLATLEKGPGSTIKVPFYTALIYQVPLNWSNLGLSFPHGIMISARYKNGGNSRDVVPRFGYDTVSGPHKLEDAGSHRVKGWDEMGGEYSHFTGGVLSPSDFIATSNNFYFGTLLMLGAYDANRIRGTLSQVLQSSSAEEHVFPKIVMDNQYYCFRERLYEHFHSCSNEAHALEAGLRNFFRFTVTPYGHQRDVGPISYLFGDKSGNSFVSLHANYVLTDFSFLKRDVGNVSGRKEFYDNHFNLTSGGAKVLSVSPLNMAEMYLRIALLNNREDCLLTFNDSVYRVPQPASSPSEHFSTQMMGTVYLGMHKVIYQRDGIHNGTLSGTKVGNELKAELQSRGIHLYGKTGTAGTGAHENNYHYAFILSNMPLETETDRSNLKVYIVYFGYYNGSLGHSGTCPTRDRIIHEIINSESFRNYWEQNNNENQNE